MNTIDTCLESLAHQLENRAVAVILSGTGKDGSRGVRAIQANHGFAFVQKPDDAECEGMPLSALCEVDDAACLPADKIAEKLADLALPMAKPVRARVIDLEIDQFDELAKIILDRCHIDLREYKKNTLERRLERRIEESGRKNIADYIDYVKKMWMRPNDLRRASDG